MRRISISAVERIADAAQHAANEIPPGQPMTIDLGLQLGPPCRIIPQHPLQRRSDIDGGDTAEPTAHARYDRKLTTHAHTLDARRSIRRHQRRHGREQCAIELLLRQLQFDGGLPLACMVAFGGLDRLA
ncbi:MAG: hypothetical protein FJ252_06250 [Phycisphaerae bacterium]|nr:hypothetical protein [Phycisphaerae bacterium]